MRVMMRDAWRRRKELNASADDLVGSDCIEVAKWYRSTCNFTIYADCPCVCSERQTSGCLVYMSAFQKWAVNIYCSLCASPSHHIFTNFLRPCYSLQTD